MQLKSLKALQIECKGLHASIAAIANVHPCTVTRVLSGSSTYKLEAIVKAAIKVRDKQKEQEQKRLKKLDLMIITTSNG